MGTDDEQLILAVFDSTKSAALVLALRLILSRLEELESSTPPMCFRCATDDL